MNVWLFGYGSLIWRPDIDYIDRRRARLPGWERRFWQGSHDHRGLPDDPGRVVTLIESAKAGCDGMAYLVERELVVETFEALDHREKNGYQRVEVVLELAERAPTPGVVYIAPVNNHAFLGPAPLPEMAAQIRSSEGPSGRNIDYLLDLADALRELDADDPHVFELEAAVRGHTSQPHQGGN
ncbi:MAG: gamma-glutamylcyclotransferase [Gammaproteobacteria bacterium]|nr:gamma-glutamylcyclotransferase [Gammaproteobacteria bacterium]